MLVVKLKINNYFNYMEDIMDNLILSNFMFGENIDVYSKIVYMGLKKYVNKVNNACFPAKKKLALECGISMSTLNKAIKRLVDAGVLKKDFRFRENKSQTSNLYTLTPFLTSGECYFAIRQDIFEIGLQAKEIIVYSYLCSVANQDMECYPSIKTIAASCSMSETTVKGTLKELVNKNLIEKTSQYRSDGGKRNNLYKIIQEEAEEVIKREFVEEIIGQDQVDEKNTNDSFTNPEQKKEVQSVEKLSGDNRNNSYDAIDKKFNKKLRKEIKKMKIRDDIFSFKLSENSFMIYLYINSVNCANKPYFPSEEEICKKLNISDSNVKASLAELHIKGLISKISAGHNHPIGVSKTPPQAKEIHP